MSAQSIDFLVLGTTEATRSGQAIPLGGHRRRALLTRLLLHPGRTVPAQTLLEDVWDDGPKPATRGTLHSHISQLRAVLGNCIGHRAGGYLLDLAGSSLDAVKFEAALDSAVAHLASGRLELARQLLHDSLGMWRGEAMHDVSDRSWAQAEAARLSELRRVAEEQLLQTRLDAGEQQQLVADAEAAVATDPLREQRWALLMLALYRSGQQADALEAYRRLRDLLAGELGIDPSRPMVELQTAILQHDPRLDTPRGEAIRRAPDTSSVQALHRAHAAAEAGDWLMVRESLIAAESSGPLDLDDLALLGDAAFMAGDQDTSIAARRRAHSRCASQDDATRAAEFALQIVCNHYVRNEPAIAAGWMDRARSLLDGTDECAAHGTLAYTDGLIAMAGGDPTGAVTQGARAQDVGARWGDRDVEALGQAVRAGGLARLGDIDAALPLFEEAFTTACAGKLGPVPAGQVMCWSTQALLSIAEYDRARRWVELVDQSGMAFPGDCHVHRAELLRATGEIDAAAAEAATGRREAQHVQPLHAGIAHYEMGMLHLASGALNDAQQSFALAEACGASSQPGAALVQLALGDVDGAYRAITAAMAHPTLDELARVRLLPATVRIAVAAGEHAQADRHAAKLERIIKDLAAPGLEPIATATRADLNTAHGSRR